MAVNSVDGTKIAMGSDAQGDILYHGATDYARLAKGTAGQVLKMNSGATAPEWGVDAGLPAAGVDGQVLTSDGTNWASEAAPGGGKVLQCLGMVSSSLVSTTSTSFVDSPVTLAITPASSSNKILVFSTFHFGGVTYNSAGPHVALFRGTTQLSTDIVKGHMSANYCNDSGQQASFNYLDSWAGRVGGVAETFKLKYLTEGSTAYFGGGPNANWGGGVSSIILMEISV
jgi:hypothetical protein